MNWEDSTEDYNVFEQRQLDLELEAERQGDEELHRLYLPDVTILYAPGSGTLRLTTYELSIDMTAEEVEQLTTFLVERRQRGSVKKPYVVCGYVMDYKVFEHPFGDQESARRFAESHRGKWTNALGDNAESFQYTHAIVFTAKREVVQFCEFPADDVQE